VLVRLYLSEYVSRSEARRLLAGLEKFREVILDMNQVKRPGQAFADEVFRVFPSQDSVDDSATAPEPIGTPALPGAG